MKSDKLIEYLEKINKDSKFSAQLSDRGGYITFSNSGQRGTVKYFTLGLDALIQVIKDIKLNLESFQDEESYIEQQWRDLGAEFYTDESANAMATVQTKPLFTTISKLIAWANDQPVTTYKDNFIDLSPNSIEKAIQELEALANLYSPVEKNPILEKQKTVLQKIYYGAPGTGKSHKIESILKKISQEDQKERITFHPEYDYSSFVGGYKPSSEDGKEIKYKFVPQVFTNIYVSAWKNLDKDYYLAIEEINRGNCAEIFGDLFQLLDRNSNYSISPSKELLDYLKNALSGNEGIAGDKMKLPPNLHILASMNTSDQSLFPMDTAFKRRWAWEYVPINCEELNEDGTKNESYDYKVNLGDGRYFDWINFIQKTNILIKPNKNLGPDKCIGNYFIKPEGKQINFEEFINKAIFYLWIDVFKDEEDSVFSQIGEETSYEDFFPIQTKGKENLIKLLNVLGVEIKGNTSAEETLKTEEVVE